MAGGRPRKPTALHELEGTGQASRMNPDEPRLPAAIPERPEWVDPYGEAGAIYAQVTEYANRMGVTTESDGIALGILADQIALYIELRDTVRKQGNVLEVEGASGQVKYIPHPCLAQMNATLTTIHKFLREYGLTAASRPNVSSIPVKDVSTFDDFLKM